MIESHPLVALSPSQTSSTLSIPLRQIFLVGCCVFFCQLAADLRCCVFLLLFLRCSIQHPKQWDSVPPHALDPTRLLSFPGMVQAQVAQNLLTA